MPKWFRTGDDVTFDDESKVREWGGVAVDVMHVSMPCHLVDQGTDPRSRPSAMNSLPTLSFDTYRNKCVNQRPSSGIRPHGDDRPSLLTLPHTTYRL